MDKSIRRQNVERYRRLLKTTIDENQRKELLKLLSKAEQAQKDAGTQSTPIDTEPARPAPRGASRRPPLLD